MAEQTHADLLLAGARNLAAAGIEGARRDARLLLQTATGLSAENLILNETTIAEAPVAVSFDAMIARRAAGEPVSKIIGRREFMGRMFTITPEVLDPRPDTETVVQAALEQCGRSRAHILELGVGSGCILTSLLAERPNWTGVGVDISPAALNVAAQNLAAHAIDSRARLLQSNWCDAIDENETFDLVISNPPYIRAGEIAELELEVRAHDPHLALDGGSDGLEAYRAITGCAAAYLKTGAALVFEVGYDQASDVAALLRAAEIASIGIYKDLSGKERCVYGLKA